MCCLATRHLNRRVRIACGQGDLLMELKGLEESLKQVKSGGSATTVPVNTSVRHHAHISLHRRTSTKSPSFKSMCLTNALRASFTLSLCRVCRYTRSCCTTRRTARVRSCCPPRARPPSSSTWRFSTGRAVRGAHLTHLIRHKSPNKKDTSTDRPTNYAFPTKS